jgi:hypothetical protein
MGRFFLERSRIGVAMQAFTVLVRIIKRKLRRYFFQVVDIEVSQAADLGIHVAEHGVVGVTRITGAVTRNSVVLKVTGRNITRIIDVQALSIRLHDVARETKLGRFGMFEMDVSAEACRYDGEDEKGDERKYFPSPDHGERRSNNR